MIQPSKYQFRKHFICDKRLFLSRRITWKSFDKSEYALLHNIRNRILYLCFFTEGVACAVGLFKLFNLELSMASADWTLWKRIITLVYPNIDESAYWHSNAFNLCLEVLHSMQNWRWYGKWFSSFLHLFNNVNQYLPHPLFIGWVSLLSSELMKFEYLK